MKRSRVRPISAARRAEQYPDFVRSYLAWHRRCEVGPRIGTVDLSWAGCRGVPAGLHHLRKRSAAGALTNPVNVLASCDPCNGYVEDNPLLARMAGLVVREGDPSWEALGKRSWAALREA